MKLNENEVVTRAATAAVEAIATIGPMSKRERAIFHKAFMAGVKAGADIMKDVDALVKDEPVARGVGHG